MTYSSNPDFFSCLPKLETGRVLGIDAALRCTGYAVIEFKGRKLAIADCGVIRTPQKQPISECLRRLAGGISEIIMHFSPVEAAIEGAFFYRNARTAHVLGMARGTAVSRCAENQISVFEYSPRKVKQAICGNGAATKDQVALLIGQIFSSDINKIGRDATDALAIALCHFNMATSFKGAFLSAPL